jgi:hypothetical protein
MYHFCIQRTVKRNPIQRAFCWLTELIEIGIDQQKQTKQTKIGLRITFDGKIVYFKRKVASVICMHIKAINEKRLNILYIEGLFFLILFLSV